VKEIFRKPSERDRRGELPYVAEEQDVLRRGCPGATVEVRVLAALSREAISCPALVRVDDVLGVYTVFRSGPYRFFFYSADADEPPHVHADRDRETAKFWLEPVRLERSRGFGRVELGRIQALVEGNSDSLVRIWHEYFGF